MFMAIMTLVAMFASIIVTENYMLDLLQKDDSDESTKHHKVAD
ncbi:hypothetical protein [Leptolyngbya sp. 7M]|nr:hypothetical protein [Leptolyngbya sp. 7M]